MPGNAFIGKSEKPDEAELSAALGKSTELWNQLIEVLVHNKLISSHDWYSYSPKAGWSKRLKLGTRTILYLSPQTGVFMVSFAFGEKAIQAIHEGDFPRSLIAIVDSARKYAEGTGVRLNVNNTSDLETVVKLAAIKVAH